MICQSHDPKVVAELDWLEGQIDVLLRQCPDDVAFWKVIGRETKTIVEGAAPQDCEYVQGRIDSMLKIAAMVPGGGKPCK